MNEKEGYITLEINHNTGRYGEGLSQYFACESRAAQLVKNSQMLDSNDPDIVILQKSGLAEEFSSYYTECR